MPWWLGGDSRLKDGTAALDLLGSISTQMCHIFPGSLRGIRRFLKGYPSGKRLHKLCKDPPFFMGKSTISIWPCSSSQTVSLPEASFHHQKLRLSDVLFSSWSNCRKWMEMVAECDRSIFGGDQGQGPGGYYRRVVWLQDVDWRRLLYIVNETGMKQV